MMREIVDHQCSPDFASHIHPTLHTAKRRERLGDLLGWDAASLRDDERRHGVQDVMPSPRGQRKFSKRLPPMRHPKAHDFPIHPEPASHPIITALYSTPFTPTE